jgi:hypothetical protein
MNRFQLSLRCLMFAVAICGLFCWPLGLVVRQALESKREAACSANLAEIGAALENYEAKYGSFPPAYLTDAKGKPTHSWRVLLLEFLDPPLFGRYNFHEPWDGPNNSKLASKMPRVFACPGHDGPLNRPTTSYAVIVGPETAFPNSGVVRVVDITDRTLNIPTVLVAEAANAKIPWMEPRDLRSDAMEPLGDDLRRSGLSSPHRAGAGLLCFRGEIRRVKPSMRMHYLKNMLTISGNESFCDTSY